MQLVTFTLFLQINIFAHKTFKQLIEYDVF